MIERCTSPRYARYDDYGGRGIKVCDRWLSFENFLADMGERPDGLTLDRLNNDGNYELVNCRWATLIEQRANRRATGFGMKARASVLRRAMGEPEEGPV